jgi:hypothetical protein
METDRAIAVESVRNENGDVTGTVLNRSAVNDAWPERSRRG